MLPRLAIPSLVLALQLACAGLARAQPEGEGDAPPDAAALIRRGVDLRRDHRNDEALAAFRAAAAQSPTPLARAQIGLAEQALGRWLDAESDLGAALAASGDDWIAKNRAVLEESASAIRQHLAWLTVDVDVASARVQIDGRALPRSAEARVVAGTAVLEVHAAGYTPDIRRVDLAPGAHERVAIALAPLVALPARPVTAAAPAESNPAPPSDSPSLVGPIVLGGVGVVGLGLGAYFGLHTLSEKSARDAACPDASCSADRLAHDSNARTAATISTIAFAAGAASLAGGIAWYLLDRRSHPRAASVRPMMVAGGAGLAFEGLLP